jgi:hypothetical protein
MGGRIRNMIARNTIAAYIMYTTCNGLSNNFIIIPVSFLSYASRKITVYRWKYLITAASPVLVQVNTGNHTGGIVTGCENNPEVLSFFGIAFQRIGRARFIEGIGFLGVNASGFQDFDHFLFCNMAAIHPASGVTGIFKRGMPV